MLYVWTMLKSLGATVKERQEGATMVEYGLLVALIAIVVAAGAAILGGAIDGLFKDTASQL